MIPRIIHQFWHLGDPPEDLAKWSKTWVLDGWSHQLWDADDLVEEFGIDRPELSPVHLSTLACWHALREFGGVWVDMDMEYRAPFDHLLDREVLLGTDHLEGKAQTCVFGAVPGHWLLDRLIEAEELLPYTPHRREVGRKLVNKYLPANLALVEPEVFYPIGPDGKVRSRLELASAINHRRWKVDHIGDKEVGNAKHDRQLRPRAPSGGRQSVVQGLQVHR